MDTGADLSDVIFLRKAYVGSLNCTPPVRWTGGRYGLVAQLVEHRQRVAPFVRQGRRFESGQVQRQSPLRAALTGTNDNVPPLPYRPTKQVWAGHFAALHKGHVDDGGKTLCREQATPGEICGERYRILSCANAKGTPVAGSTPAHRSYNRLVRVRTRRWFKRQQPRERVNMDEAMLRFHLRSK